MKCLKKETIIKYIDDELTGNDYDQVEIHLRICSDCRANYENLLERINLIRSSLNELNPNTVSIPAFEYPETEKKHRRHGLLRPAVVVFSMFIVASGALWIFTRDDTDKDIMKMEYAVNQNMDIVNPNVMWHERRLTITILDTRHDIYKKILTSKYDDSIRIEAYELHSNTADNNF